MIANKRTTILLLGVTGNGKSTLGNVLLGKEVFKVGDDIDSCTNQTQLESSIVNGTQINIIDTPGFDDSNGNDIGNIEKMINFLKRYEKGINLVVITQPANQKKFKMSDNILMKQIYKMFGTSKFFEHVCVVYTNCNKNQFNSTKKQNLLNMTERIRDELKVASGYNYNGNIQSFFVDSTEVNNDPNTKQQIQEILKYSFKDHCLPTSNIYNVNPHIKDTIPETRNHQVIEHKSDNSLTTYADQQRNRIIYWNGTTGYDDWVNCKYEIVERRKRKQRRTEVSYHDGHSTLGFSSRPHTHYDTFIRTFEEEKITIKDKNKSIISSCDWKMVNGTFNEYKEGDGREHGWSRQNSIVDI